MEMVESQELVSSCHSELKTTGDTHFDLGDENTFEESPAIIDKSDLNSSTVAVNGDSRLEADDGPPTELQAEAPLDECASEVTPPGEENPVDDKMENGCGEKTDETVISEDINAEGEQFSIDKTEPAVTEPFGAYSVGDAEEDKLLQGNGDDVAITDVEEDRLLNDSSVESEKEPPPIVEEAMEVDETVETEESAAKSVESPSFRPTVETGESDAKSAKSPSFRPTVETGESDAKSVESPPLRPTVETEESDAKSAESPPFHPNIDDDEDDDDDASVGVEVVPEEKAEIIVREEVDIPLESPKTDEDSRGESAKEKFQEETESKEDFVEEENVKVSPNVVDEDISHDEMDSKSNSSEIPEIQSKGVVDASKDEDCEVKIDEKPEDAETSATKCRAKDSTDNDCEILTIEPGESSEDSTPASPGASDLKRRRRSESSAEESVDDLSEKPAKKLKKTETALSSADEVESGKEKVAEVETKYPAKTYVAASERKKQIFEFVEYVYSKPEMRDIVERLEVIMLKSFGEVIASETPNGKARLGAQKIKDEFDLLSKTITGYRKQKEDMKLVVQKVIDVAKHSKPGEAVVPPKVTRSVGLQVCTVGSMYIKSRDTKKSPGKLTTATPVPPKAQVTSVSTPTSVLKIHPPSNGPIGNNSPLSSGTTTTTTIAKKQTGGSFILRQNQIVNAKNSTQVTNGRQRVVTSSASNGSTIVTKTPQRRLLPAPQTPSSKLNTPGSLTRLSPQTTNSISRPANSNIVKKSTSSVPPMPSVTITSTSKPAASTVAEVVIDLTEKDEEASPRPRPVARKRTSGVNSSNPSLSVKKVESQNNICTVPLPKSPIYPASVVRPPTPNLRLCESQAEGVMLSWQFDSSDDVSKINKYQLFAIQAQKPPSPTGSPESAPPEEREWRKIGDVNALPLPMACTLTQFKKGSRYAFSVRAVDKENHVGEFSNICNSLIK